MRVIEEQRLVFGRPPQGATQVHIVYSNWFFEFIFSLFGIKCYCCCCCFVLSKQEVIERNTLPHKYKRVRRTSEIEEDEGEKCTICLSLFEIENDVR